MAINHKTPPVDPQDTDEGWVEVLGGNETENATAGQPAASKEVLGGCPGANLCAGCYSIGVVGGREGH